MSERNERAGAAWQAMRTLVLDRYDRRPEVSAALGMSFVRMKAVRHIAAGPITQRELAEVLGTDAPYITLVVNDLERQGYVERRTHPDDRRCKLVVATTAGRAAARRADKILGEPPAALAALDADDLAALDRILTTLLG